MFSELGLSSSEGQANVRFRAASSPPVRRSSSSRDRHTVSLNSVGPERSSMRVNSGWKIVGIFGTFLRGKFPDGSVDDGDPAQIDYVNIPYPS